MLEHSNFFEYFLFSNVNYGYILSYEILEQL